MEHSWSITAETCDEEALTAPKDRKRSVNVMACVCVTEQTKSVSHSLTEMPQNENRPKEDNVRWRKLCLC
jgi:hypothetical protein